MGMFGGSGGGGSFGVDFGSGGLPSFGGGGGVDTGNMGGMGGLGGLGGAGMAGLGSMLSGAGKGIGGVLGGPMNPFKGPEWQSMGSSNVAPTVKGPGQAHTYNAEMMGMGSDPFKQAQLATIQKLQNQANGTGPSVAQQALQKQTDANIASQMAMANSARGGFNPALARAAMQQGAQANASLATQAASVKMNEQLQAAQILGGIAGQGRAGDIQIASNNQQAANQQAQQYAQLQAYYANMGIDAQKANQLAQLDMMKVNNAAIYSNNQTGLAAQGAQQQKINGFMQNLSGGFGQLSTLMGGGGGAAAGGAGMAGGADLGSLASFAAMA